jgi:nitroreductase
MKTLTCSVLLLLAGMSLAVVLPAADAPGPIKLPAPRTEGGKPLMEALKLRSTSRAFAPDPLPLQTLSNLLWAAWGINRPDGRRTAPSARNWQEIDVVVVLPEGAYVYDAAGNVLNPLASGDLRALTGSQEFVKEAPVTLVYLADTLRMKGAQPDQVQPWAFADASFISQNVYLYCASEGLATGVRALLDRPALAKALKLADTRMVIMAQCVGFPRK